MRHADENAQNSQASSLKVYLDSLASEKVKCSTVTNQAR